MGVMVIACYRPKPGHEEALGGLVAALRKEGLVGDGPSLCGRAGDGTIVFSEFVLLESAKGT